MTTNEFIQVSDGAKVSFIGSNLLTGKESWHKGQVIGKWGDCILIYDTTIYVNIYKNYVDVYLD